MDKPSSPDRTTNYGTFGDKPKIPAAGGSIPSWVKETQNLVALSGFNKDLGWIDI